MHALLFLRQCLFVFNLFFFRRYLVVCLAKERKVKMKRKGINKK